MKEHINSWRESKWWKITGGGIFVLVLLFCLAGWRGNYQHNITHTLQDVFREAWKADVARGKSKLLTIYLEGEGKTRYRTEYRAAELSDEQFARLQGSSSSWREQKARVTESVPSGGGNTCGLGMYCAEMWEDVHVYRMGDRSRYYLLVEDRSAGREYVTRLQNCYYDDGEAAGTVGGILKDFVGIRGEGDISKIILENTWEIEEGESNILAVYTREEDKKELYEHLCRIPFEGDIEEEFLNAAYEEELLQKEIDEVKGEAYYIEVENKQGETFFWKYQIAGLSQIISDADYLLMNQGEFVVGVPEEDSVKNKFFTRKFVPAAQSLQVLGRHGY